MEKLSMTYRLMRKIGLNYSEKEYGQVSLWQVFKRVCKTYRDGFLLKYMMNSWLLSPLEPRKIRPWVLKKIGCHVGKDIFVGDNVRIDAGHADLIYIDDHVRIADKLRKEPTTILGSSFGLGLSWGTMLLKTKPMVVPDMIAM